MTRVRFNGTHPESIAGGRTVEPGEEFELDLDHDDNKRFVDEGLVLVLDTPQPAEPADDPADDGAAEPEASDPAPEPAKASKTSKGGSK